MAKKTKKDATKRHRNLDRVDRAILAALQEDGRISNVALAEEVHLSPSPCLERVKRLEAAGYISGYTARLNAEMLGYGKVAFIQVSLEKTTEEVFLGFKTEVIESDFVSECHMVAGGYDYILKVRFNDMENYRSVLERIVHFPGVSQTHTYMVIEQVKILTDVPLD